MNRRRHWTQWLLLIVAVITLISSIGQFFAPDRALAFLGLEANAGSVYLFRFLSMLVALFGCALLHTTLTTKFESDVLLWVGLQKLVSVAAICLGLAGGILTATGLFVAGYDFAAGLYVLWFNRWGKRQ